MKRLSALALIPLLTLALTGCDSDTGTDTKPESEAATVEQSGDTTTVEVEEEVVEEPANTNPTFGDTYTWDDGLAVTISEPEEATLSEYAGEMYDLEAGTPIAFTVTLTNGTDKDVEAMMINTKMTSGGKESEAIFDSVAGVDLPTATVLPGKSLEWKIGFVVADPADMILTVSDVLDFNSDKVHFTN